MKMKTTDGRDAINDVRYFTVDGQEVILCDCIMLPSGEYKYLVRYFYEGEGTDVKCYGDKPVEINYPFEVEGDETMINKMFEKPPTPVMSDEYKKGCEKAIELQDFIEKYRVESRELEKEVGNLRKRKEKLLSDIETLVDAKKILEVADEEN